MAYIEADHARSLGIQPWDRVEIRPMRRGGMTCVEVWLGGEYVGVVGRECVVVPPPASWRGLRGWLRRRGVSRSRVRGFSVRALRAMWRRSEPSMRIVRERMADMDRRWLVSVQP